MKLYGYFRSSAAYRVRIALNLKGIEAEHVPVHLLKDGGQQHQANYLARNPQAIVPALELDDGTMLTQSLAIVEYLDAIIPEPRLIPADPLQAAKVRAVAMAIACEIHPLNNLRVLDYLNGPLHHSEEEVRQWYEHWLLNGGLVPIEGMLPHDEFCFGNAPTLADCCLIPQLFNARRYKVSTSTCQRYKVEESCSKLKAFEAAYPSRQPDYEGDIRDPNDPEDVLIPRETARRLLGSVSHATMRRLEAKRSLTPVRPGGSSVYNRVFYLRSEVVGLMNPFKREWLPGHGP